jgi:hypothetical protein
MRCHPVHQVIANGVDKVCVVLFLVIVPHASCKILCWLQVFQDVQDDRRLLGGKSAKIIRLYQPTYVDAFERNDLAPLFQDIEYPPQLSWSQVLNARVDLHVPQTDTCEHAVSIDIQIASRLSVFTSISRFGDHSQDQSLLRRIGLLSVKVVQR